MAEPPALLAVENLTVSYRSANGRIARAVRGVSFRVAAGEVLSIVGGSGSGKTSVSRAVLRLSAGSVGGRILLDGVDFAALGGRALTAARRRIQPVFQNPYSSLNPMLPVGRAVAEPMRIHGLASRAEAERRGAALLRRVGLDPASDACRRPREFSGGQRQRIAVARALAAEPDLLILDEPVSALDVSEQARILNLLADLRAERGLAYLLISHDLRVVRHVSDRVAVMYGGTFVEEGPAEAVFTRPAHPYTRALVAAAPAVGPAARPGVRIGRGEPPDPAAPPAGCAYHPRCPFAEAACADSAADLSARPAGDGHVARCRRVPL